MSLDINMLIQLADAHRTPVQAKFCYDIIKVQFAKCFYRMLS